MNSSSNPVNEKSIYLTSQIKTFSNKLYILQIHEYILLIDDAFDINIISVNHTKMKRKRTSIKWNVSLLVKLTKTQKNYKKMNKLL